MMGIGIATLAATEQLPEKLALTQERLEILVQSGTAECQQDGWARIRVLGAGSAAPGGKGGACGLKTLRVKRGDRLVCTIGAAGGTTTVSGAGVNISVPPGAGANPQGLDYFQHSQNKWPNLFFGNAQAAHVAGFQPSGYSGHAYFTEGSSPAPAAACVMHLPVPCVLGVPGGSDRPLRRALAGSHFASYSGDQEQPFGYEAGGPGLVVIQWLEVFA